MSNNKVLGWLSLVVFIIAILFLLFGVILLVSPPLLSILNINSQALIIISDAFALIAAILGFFSRHTRQGKIGGIGGLIIFILLTILLSFTLITGVSRQVGPA